MDFLVVFFKNQSKNQAGLLTDQKNSSTDTRERKSLLFFQAFFSSVYISLFSMALTRITKVSKIAGALDNRHSVNHHIVCHGL